MTKILYLGNTFQFNIRGVTFMKYVSLMVFIILSILVIPSIFPSSIVAGDTLGEGSGSSRSPPRIVASYAKAPLLDGKVYGGDSWNLANELQVNFQGGGIKLMASHDNQNLYFYEECVKLSISVCPLYMYFEDDGSAPDRTLDDVNEDLKYISVNGSKDTLIDATWKNGWTSGTSGERQDGRIGRIFNNDYQTIEWSIPLHSGENQDINVTGPEDIGFALGKNGGWPTADTRPDDPSTWGTVFVDYHPSKPPTAKIISPLENDFVHGLFTAKINATDYSPTEDISKVELSLNNGSWKKTTLQGAAWTYDINTTAFAESQRLNLKVRANDSILESKVVEVNVTVRNNVSDKSPILIKPIPDKRYEQNFSAKNVLVLDDYFKDPDAGQILIYRIMGNVHVKVYVNSNHSVDLAGDAGWNGTETIVIRADDGTDWVEGLMKVIVLRPKVYPVINYNGTLLKLRVGKDFFYSLTAWDPAHGLVQYFVDDSNDTGVTIDQYTGYIRWTPDESEIGYHTIRIRVSNREASSYVNVTMQVLPSDVPKTLAGRYGNMINQCPCGSTRLGTMSFKGEIHFFIFYLEQGDVLAVSISTVPNLDFFLMNETNTLNYLDEKDLDNLSYIPNGTKENTADVAYHFTAPATGYYTVIIDNTYIGSATQVDRATYTYNISCTKKIVPKPPPKKNEPGGQSIMAIGVLVVIVIICGIVVYMLYSKKEKAKTEASRNLCQFPMQPGYYPPQGPGYPYPQYPPVQSPEVRNDWQYQYPPR